MTTANQIAKRNSEKHKKYSKSEKGLRGLER